MIRVNLSPIELTNLKLAEEFLEKHGHLVNNDTRRTIHNGIISSSSSMPGCLSIETYRSLQVSRTKSDILSTHSSSHSTGMSLQLTSMDKTPKSPNSGEWDNLSLISSDTDFDMLINPFVVSNGSSSSQNSPAGEDSPTWNLSTADKAELAQFLARPSPPPVDDNYKYDGSTSLVGQER